MFGSEETVILCVLTGGTSDVTPKGTSAGTTSVFLLYVMLYLGNKFNLLTTINVSG